MATARCAEAVTSLEALHVAYNSANPLGLRRGAVRPGGACEGKWKYHTATYYCGIIRQVSSARPAEPRIAREIREEDEGEKKKDAGGGDERSVG